MPDLLNFSNEIIEFDYMFMDTVCAHVCANMKEHKVTQTAFTSDLIFMPMNPKYLGLDYLWTFFESRCVPQERVNIAEILKILKVPYYDAYLICRKTHGRLFSDQFWIRFANETLTWKDLINNDH